MDEIQRLPFSDKECSGEKLTLCCLHGPPANTTLDSLPGKAYGKVHHKESATRALINWKGGGETGMG